MENKDKKDLTDFLNSVTNNGTWVDKGGRYEKETKDDKKK